MIIYLDRDMNANIAGVDLTGVKGTPFNVPDYKWEQVKRSLDDNRMAYTIVPGDNQSVFASDNTDKPVSLKPVKNESAIEKEIAELTQKVKNSAKVQSGNIITQKKRYNKKAKSEL